MAERDRREPEGDPEEPEGHPGQPEGDPRQPGEARQGPGEPEEDRGQPGPDPRQPEEDPGRDPAASAARRGRARRTSRRREAEQVASLHEHVEVHRVEVAARGVREPRHVPRRDRARRPSPRTRDARSTDARRAGRRPSGGPAAGGTAGRSPPTSGSPAPRKASQPLPATSRWRVSAKLTTREVQHRVGREQVEVGQGEVGARDEPVDLVGLGRELRLVAAKRGAARGRRVPLARVAERLGQALDGEQAPGDARSRTAGSTKANVWGRTAQRSPAARASRCWTSPAKRIGEDGPRVAELRVPARDSAPAAPASSRRRRRRAASEKRRAPPGVASRPALTRPSSKRSTYIQPSSST